jgi:hypothetical protein
MQLKARFLRWYHLQAKFLTAFGEGHCAVTISKGPQVFKWLFIPICTEYLGCTCGKSWYGEKTELVKQIEIIHKNRERK